MRLLEIEIPVKPSRLPFRGNTKKYRRHIPEKWNELTREQLHQVLTALFGHTDTHLQNRFLLKALMDLPRKAFAALTPELIYELTPLTKFLKETNSLTVQLQPCFRLPIRGRWRCLHAPGELLVNLSFAEFIVSEKYFLRWQKSGAVTHLHHLVATLYRPKRYFHALRKALGDYSGDLRTPFNEHLVPDRAKQVAHLPEVQLLAVLTWYRGCRNALESLYPNIFSAEKEQSADSGSAGWEPVLRGMSGGKFGDFEKTKHVQAHTVLKEMDAQLKQAKELEAKYPKH